MKRAAISRTPENGVFVGPETISDSGTPGEFRRNHSRRGVSARDRFFDGQGALVRWSHTGGSARSGVRKRMSLMRGIWRC